MAPLKVNGDLGPPGSAIHATGCNCHDCKTIESKRMKFGRRFVTNRTIFAELLEKIGRVIRSPSQKIKCRSKFQTL